MGGMGDKFHRKWGGGVSYVKDNRGQHQTFPQHVDVDIPMFTITSRFIITSSYTDLFAYDTYC